MKLLTSSARRCKKAVNKSVLEALKTKNSVQNVKLRLLSWQQKRIAKKDSRERSLAAGYSA
jgi:hypothetical protein